jgi:hypothetical protein
MHRNGFNPHPSLHQDATPCQPLTFWRFNPHPSLHQDATSRRRGVSNLLVSILILPYIRMRRYSPSPRCGGWRDAVLFQSSSFPTSGCDSLRVARLTRFQSSSFPTSGCDIAPSGRHLCIAHTCSTFQSSSFPTSGCDDRAARSSETVLPGFNPHPSLHQDATRCVETTVGWAITCRCFNPHPSLHQDATRPGVALPIFMRFNPHPSLHQDATGARSVPVLPDGFNPHPSLHQDATLSSSTLTASVCRFQSSSFPTSGCDAKITASVPKEPVGYEFQSSSFPTSGCDVRPSCPQIGRSGFNPHPSLHQDATRVHVASYPHCVSILILPYIRMRRAVAASA